MFDSELLRREKTAEKIVRLTQDQLVSYLPFFNRAILRMPIRFLREDEIRFDLEVDFGCDGDYIYGAADAIIQYYKTDFRYFLRLYLHMILHCLFSHPFQYDMMIFDLWDISCDIAVENTISELKLSDMSLPDDHKRGHVIYELKKKFDVLTAENIYNYYRWHPKESKELQQNAGLFHMDNHQFWADYRNLISRDNFSDSDKKEGKGENSKKFWDKVGKTVMLDVQSFDKFQELVPGSAIDNIKNIKREKYNYTEFLKRFTKLNEEIRVNQEEFDYIYYTYGMKLYGNMPLIEPLEYQESKKIHDFVIAIDTSGSCQGSVVRSFLRKTAAILKDSTSFFTSMNVHIIQCDSMIQHDQKITSEKDFDDYLIDLNVQGFGGTDFRPVFEYVDELIKKKELNDLKGLIYFTDGIGTYPKAAPPYPTAFLVLDDENEKPEVPPWAIKYMIRPEELPKAKTIMKDKFNSGE